VVEAVFLWRRLVGAQVRSQFQYRVSFVLDLAGNFLISFIDFLAVLVIFHNVPQLGTWNVHEVAFLYAFSSISFALTDLLIGHLDQFPQKIRDGNFDILLVRPRGTLFQVIGSDFQLRRLGKAVQGVIVLAWVVGSLGVHWDVGRIAMLIVMVPAAIVIFSSVWVVGGCLAFWTTDGGEFSNAFT
jgi:ABC-2 type transport system permease protein